MCAYIKGRAYMVCVCVFGAYEFCEVCECTCVCVCVVIHKQILMQLPASSSLGCSPSVSSMPDITALSMGE